MDDAEKRIAELEGKLATATVLLHEYRASHDADMPQGIGVCSCDSCTKATKIVGERAA